jgi:hypothetical protein
MRHTPDPRHVAEQMLVADGLLGGLANGSIAMHPAAYQALAAWVRASFDAIDSAALRQLRDAAPPELQGIAEVVLQERRVISWAADDVVGLSSLAELLNLLGRIPRRGPVT